MRNIYINIFVSFPFAALEIEDVTDSSSEKSDTEQKKSPPNVTKVMTGMRVPDLLIK